MWDVECGMWDVECGMWNVEWMLVKKSDSKSKKNQIFLNKKILSLYMCNQSTKYQTKK